MLQGQKLWCYLLRARPQHSKQGGDQALPMPGALVLLRWMQAVHTERGGLHLQGVNGAPFSPFSLRKVVVLKRSIFFLMQSFAFSVGAAFCKQKRSEPRSNKHFEGFLWVGFQRSCRIKTFSDNWVNISSSLSQHYLEERRFHFPLRKTKIFVINSQENRLTPS